MIVRRSCMAARRAMAELRPGEHPAGALAGHLAACSRCRRVWSDQSFARAVLATAKWPTSPTTRSADGPAHAEPVWPERARPADDRARPLADLAPLAVLVAIVALIVAYGRSEIPPRADPVVPPPLTAPTATATPPPSEKPAWIADADPWRIKLVPVGTGPFLTGYDLLVDQVLEFTLSPLWRGRDDARCEAIWLDWDDGTGEPLPCPPPDSSPPAELTRHRYPLRHPYRAPGNYQPRIWMLQRGGTLLEVPVADFVVLDRHVSLGPVPAGTPPAAVETRHDVDYALVCVLFVAMAMLIQGAAHRRRLPSSKLEPARNQVGRVAGRAERIAPRIARIPAVVPAGLMLAAAAGLFLGGTAIRPEAIAPVIGRRGLDPLRPDAELVGATVSRGWRPDHGRLELEFADGRVEVAEPPVVGGWRSVETAYGDIIPRHEDGLGRLRTMHAALGLAFADRERDGVAIGVPTPLRRHPSASDALVFDAAWFRAACLAEGNLIPSPDERSALLLRRFAVDSRSDMVDHPAATADPSPAAADLRLTRVDLANGAAVPERPLVRDAAWSPDGRWVVTREGHARLVIRDGERLTSGAAVEVDAATGYAVSGDGIWVARADGVWRADWPGPASGEAAPEAAGLPPPLAARRVFAWPAHPDFQPRSRRPWIAVDPGRRRIAYACQAGSCLVDAAGRPVAAVADAVRDAIAHHAVWHPEGAWLARLEVGDLRYRKRSGYPWRDDAGSGTRLRLIGPDGAVRNDRRVSSGGETSPPRWSAGGRWLVFTTCPEDGRRIVAADAETGTVLDLSQPGWDAWAALMPRSSSLLLHNGRGGLWRAPLMLPGASR